MKTKKDYFFCSPKLLQNIEQLKEIDACLLAVQWRADFHLQVGNKKYSIKLVIIKPLKLSLANLDGTHTLSY